MLDEADRMLDMGFGPVIKSIVESESMVPKHERQTLMLSATFPENIQVLAGSYLNDYIFITVGLVGGASSDIMQTVLEIPSSEKRAKLEEILLESGISFLPILTIVRLGWITRAKHFWNLSIHFKR